MPLKLQTFKFPARALHYVLKIEDRHKNIQFFQDILGLKVLRHIEYEEECPSSCSGTIPILWSKTFLGYGSEDDHFAIELTWNSKLSCPRRGNGFIGITIISQDSIARAKALKWPVKNERHINYVESPDGYRFFLIDKPEPVDKDPIIKVTLSSTNIDKTVTYWVRILGMSLICYSDDRVIFNYDPSQASVEFLKIDEPINRGSVYGRIAFSVPNKDLQDLETRSRDTKQTILTPMMKLDIPGRITSNIVKLADPDGHIICFIDDESFGKISHYDPQGEAFLYYCITKFKKKLEEVTMNSQVL